MRAAPALPPPPRRCCVSASRAARSVACAYSMGVNQMLILKALSPAGLFADEQASHAAGNGLEIVPEAAGDDVTDEDGELVD